jgi:proteasome lid subunit RPN8/RPN11
MDKEIGFVLCRDRRGRLSRGVQVTGDRSSVSVPMNCPRGSKVIGLWHTHPSGSLELSRRDIATGKQFKLSHVCTSNGKPGSTRCYRIPDK